MKKLLFFSILLCALCLIAGCKKDEPLSSAKVVTAFAAQNTEGDYFDLSISTTKHLIKIYPVCPTNESTITVTPTVSTDAVSSLAPGSVLDLRQTQKFTVTAEDGSIQEWSIILQGVSMYSSDFWQDCNFHLDIPCTLQFNDLNITPITCTQIGSDVAFRFYLQSTEPNSYYPALFAGFNLRGRNLNNDLKGVYSITKWNDTPVEASFTHKGENVFGDYLPYINAPEGAFGITYMDTENRLISGWYDFKQASESNCDPHTDHIEGQFYSVPY